jgi:hypothetical protein
MHARILVTHFGVQGPQHVPCLAEAHVQGSEVISLHIMDLTAWKPALDKVRPRILAEDAAALEKWWTELATKVDQFESPKLMGTHLRELTIYGGYECSLCHTRLWAAKPVAEMIEHKHVVEVEHGERFDGTRARSRW